jgi:hypothetical protein
MALRVRVNHPQARHLCHHEAQSTSTRGLFIEKEYDLFKYFIKIKPYLIQEMAEKNTFYLAILKL